ncbi:retrotransposon ORF1 [Tanacetum coccineum]
MYPLIDRLIRLILTLPVSTATSERSFSKMKLVKTRLRSTMSDDFLKSSMILNIEREIVGTLCNEKIIDDFYSKSQRRIQMMKKRKAPLNLKSWLAPGGTYFCNRQMEKVLKRYGVLYHFATAYHSQTIGQVKNTNRTLKGILEKTVKDNPSVWSRKLDDALGAFCAAYKTPIGTMPYRLLYGKMCHLPLEIEHRAYWALRSCNPDLKIAEERRFLQLHELDELRLQAYENSKIYKAQTKAYHDRKLRIRNEFKAGDKVLLYNSKYKFKAPKLRSKCPHNTQYCMENPEKAFVDYASSRIDEAGGKWAFQDARLSKFEADFKQQQSEITNKINTVLKAIIDRIMGALPSNTIKNSRLNVNSTSSVLSARKSQTGKPEEEEQDERDNLENINTNPSLPPDPSVSFITEKVRKLNSFFESLGLVPQSSNIEFVCIKEDDGDMIKLDPRENTNGRVNNFTGRIKGMHVFIGNFTYVIDFMIIEDTSSIIDPRLSQVVLGKPFVEISNMTHDPPEGVVRFTNRTGEITYKMPHNMEEYNSQSDLKSEHTKSVYLRNKEDKRTGVEYVMSKILGFYKECLELGPEYATGIADEGEIT